MLRQVLWFLIFLYLITFPFGQFTRIPLSFLPGEVSLYLTDLLVGVIGVVGVVWGKNKPTPLDKSFFLFITAALFSLILVSVKLSAAQTIISFLYLLRLALYGLFFFTIYNLVKNKKEKVLILNSLVVLGCAVGILGIIQYFLFPDLRALLFFGWDEHVNRIVGTMLDPNFTSIILAFTLLLLLGRRKLGGLDKLVMFGVIFSAFLLTYSRSGYLAFLGGLGTYSVILKNLRIVIVGTLLLGAGIYLLPKQTSEGTKLDRITSINLRVENFKEGLVLFKSNPVFGVGFNTLRYTRPGLAEEKYGPSHSASGVDNSFLFVLVTTGIIGFIAFVNLLTQIIKESFRSKGGKKIIIPTLTALFVHSLFVNSLFYPWVLGWLALLLASILRPGKS